MSLLSLTGVSKRYGAVTALDRATLDIEPGTLTAIVGASGSGKTTLLRLIAGFEMPDEGSIMFDDVADRRAAAAGAAAQAGHWPGGAGGRAVPASQRRR